MSNVGQGFVAIAGTVVGSYFGNPQLGFQLGMLVGQQIFPTQLPGVRGPRMQDNRTTNAQIGGVVYEVFGVDVVPGTVIWMGPVIEIATTEEVGGKGGGSEQTQTTYSYKQPIALGLCRGPKAGILRIWENGLLVFDARSQLEDESDADYELRYQQTLTYRETFELYFGGSTQLPDPTIEMYRGAGNVPGYRGLMYMVYPARDLLQTQALRHPNFKIEISEDLILTSWPYPIEVVEALNISSQLFPAVVPFFIEGLNIAASMQDGTLREILRTYSAPPEDAVFISGDILSGTLHDILRTYSAPPEDAILVAGDILSGILRNGLITYDDAEPEGLNISSSLVSGTLT